MVRLFVYSEPGIPSWRRRGGTGVAASRHTGGEGAAAPHLQGAEERGEGNRGKGEGEEGEGGVVYLITRTPYLGYGEKP